MREIKFRGMPVSQCKTGERVWIEGDLIQTDDKCFIYLHGIDLQLTNMADKFNGVEGVYAAMPLLIEVDRKSVAQHTGLKDKNGVDIFEGDIVKITTEKYRVVKWITEDTRWACCNIDCSNHYNTLGTYCYDEKNLVCNELEVIGNIYEHPHLLESKNA